MNAITNSNYVNYVPVSVSVSSCFIGSRLGLMTPLTAAAYDFGTRYLFSEGCEGRASCNCCEERMSREGGRSSCNCCEEISSREGGGRVAVVSARKHLLAGEGRQLTNKDIHGTSG